MALLFVCLLLFVCRYLSVCCCDCSVVYVLLLLVAGLCVLIVRFLLFYMCACCSYQFCLLNSCRFCSRDLFVVCVYLFVVAMLVLLCMCCLCCLLCLLFVLFVVVFVA